MTDTITLDAMRDRLFTLDDVATTLAVTEPLTQQNVNSESKVVFSMVEGWTTDLDQIKDTEPVMVTMRINGTELPMTKEAALQAGAIFGLPGAYVRKTPSALITPHLNHWWNAGLGVREFNVLSVAGVIAAFVRPTLVPFSNVDLLESAVAGIRKRYGADTEILADYKILNSLAQTDVRLLIPEHARAMGETAMIDVPPGQVDLWSAGVHLSNSLIGKKQTSVDAYLFRWWCTNGATTQMSDVGTWSRRVDGQDSDVYLWAAEAVDEVLGGMEGKFDEIQALTSMNVAGNTADVLREIYSQHEVPVSQREAISAALLESETLTMYTVMQAITASANAADLDPRRADRMMRIGGAIPTAIFDTVKAQVWTEGHLAPAPTPNPYIIGGPRPEAAPVVLEDDIVQFDGFEN